MSKQNQKMTTKKTRLLTLVIVLATSVGCDQNKGQQHNQATGDTLTNLEVENIVESFRQALVEPDQAILEGLTNESLTYGHSLGLIEDRQTFIESLVSAKFKFTSLEFSEQTVDIVGNTAVVRHTLFGHTADEGKDPGTVTLKVLLVWQKDNGKLRLIARQAVRI